MATATKEPKEKGAPTHVSLEVRLTAGEADTLAWLLSRMAGLTDAGVVTARSPAEQKDAGSVARKVAERLSQA